MDDGETVEPLPAQCLCVREKGRPLLRLGMLSSALKLKTCMPLGLNPGGDELFVGEMKTPDLGSFLFQYDVQAISLSDTENLPLASHATPNMDCKTSTLYH